MIVFPLLRTIGFNPGFMFLDLKRRVRKLGSIFNFLRCIFGAEKTVSFQVFFCVFPVLHAEKIPAGLSLSSQGSDSSSSHVHIFSTRMLGHALGRLGYQINVNLLSHHGNEEILSLSL